MIRRPPVYSDTPRLEQKLSSFDPSERRAALVQLARRLNTGMVGLPRVRKEVNLHLHTFFSFNANGWSPSRVAWEAKKRGLSVTGIVDFDVLDGMEEFLSAGEVIKLKTTAALETRVFVKEYAEHVISSPNEPGIAYFMAGGCWRLPDEASAAGATLEAMREMARRRNLQVMERVNDYLDPVRLDYDTDILPLTPSGNATERHMLAAYDAKARETFAGHALVLATFWAQKLEVDEEQAASLPRDMPAFHEKMRSKLMKFGGVGYVPPAPDTFPALETVIEMIKGMDALPTATWLDGTNSGEADMPAMLDLMASKGALAMNIIPERNWNIEDPKEKRIKLANLAKAVKAAKDIDFPLCIGTEMNKLGLPFVDNFRAPELQPYVDDFLNGAFFFWGHTFLARAAGMGATSAWAEAHFGKDRRAANEFYTDAGRLANPARLRLIAGREGIESASPADVLKMLGR